VRIKIAGLAKESIVDGVGLRYTVFVQGCPHHCPGCHNPQTWNPDGGREVDTKTLIADFCKNQLLDGITLSGGEPFAQPEACAELARAAQAHGMSVWVYSGYTYDELLLRPEAAQLLEVCDVLIDGPFIQEQRTLALPWRGSRNQRVIWLKGGK